MASLWVFDIPSGGATNGFVVIGVKEISVQQPYYFWGDQRPGAGYYEEIITYVPNGNKGYNTDFAAYNESTANGGTYRLTIRSSAGDVNRSFASYPNTMQPTRIDIGMATYGTGLGFSSTNWSYNKYKALDYGDYYQAATPNVYVANQPPYGRWDVLPPNSPTGGVWHVSCGPSDSSPC